jgi:site-specific DNA recombinase
MTLASYLATTPATTPAEAIIYLRLSDFRDEDDITFAVREQELRDFAASLGLAVRRVARENDLNGNGGKPRGASAYKTPVKVAVNGLTTYRTRRPEWARVLLDLQHGSGLVLIVSDDSRISRDWRDGADLLDACREGKAYVVAPDDDGEPRWILRKGGSNTERAAFQDRINDARKYSDDVAAKVRRGRVRWAGKSWHGGPRPYGFRVEKGTEEHQRNLVVDQAEAAVIGQAADDLLRGTSVRAVTRDLRERGVPTATGAAWNTRSLTSVLTKPAVAGLARKRRGSEELVPAPWPHILDRDVWEQLRAKLADPARRTTTANEPRWLVSMFATCGVCGGLLSVGGAGRGRPPAYVGRDCGHIRREAAKVDDHIEALIIARLERGDVAGMLRPPARPDVDTAKLRADLEGVRRRKAAQVRMHAAGDLDDEALRVGQRAFREQENSIAAQLAAAADEPDPLEGLREGSAARAVWQALPLPRRRAVVQLLLDAVVIQRAGRGHRFDPATITVKWNPRLAA